MRWALTPEEYYSRPSRTLSAYIVVGAIVGATVLLTLRWLAASLFP